MLAGRVLSAQSSADIAAQLVPRPHWAPEVSPSGPLVIGSTLRIVVPPSSSRLREIGELLSTEMRRVTGVALPVVTKSCPATGAICLDTAGVAQPGMDDPGDGEEFRVDVTRTGATLHAPFSAGVMWASRTLLQLIHRSTEQNGATWQIPAVVVNDRPLYAWRGSMIDVGRHFLPVRDIERHIDLLSRYKMNVLHWHLTDDQGWRLEIKRYPKLTSVGAWRTEADGTRSGGFYTQAQVRHIVEYARRRGVSIVPEIEMPGHSSAALVAYPELACTNPPRAVPTSWGVFADIYCVGKPQVFTFLDGVLDEVMALFPSRFIHLGGDEVPKDRWKTCAECQALMKREGLANEEALQSWFMQRVATHVAAKGRTVIGWDEVLDGPFVPKGVVQSWRDSSFARVAVKRGFGVVASPSDFTYLNRSASELRAVDVLNFEARLDKMDVSERQRIFGGEVPLWSEHIVSGAGLELMALPRLAAFAEAMWSPRQRDYAEFAPRLARQEAQLRDAGYAVGPRDEALAAIAVRYDSVTQRPVLRARTFSDRLVVRATFDGSAPRATSSIVADGAVLNAANVIRLQPFWGTERVLEERRVTMRRHDGIGARVHTEPAVDARYPGTGPFSLVDGLSGSDIHGDGLWQGWWKSNVTITVELPRAMSVSRVRVNFLQNVRSWIVLPRTVAMSFSSDGATWSAPITTTHAIPTSREGAIRQPFAATPASTGAVKFVRIVAESAGPLPPGHPGAGNVAWLFADEVEITSSATNTKR